MPIVARVRDVDKSSRVDGNIPRIAELAVAGAFHPPLDQELAVVRELLHAVVVVVNHVDESVLAHGHIVGLDELAVSSAVGTPTGGNRAVRCKLGHVAHVEVGNVHVAIGVHVEADGIAETARPVRDILAVGGELLNSSVAVLDHVDKAVLIDCVAKRAPELPRSRARAAPFCLENVLVRANSVAVFLTRVRGMDTSVGEVRNPVAVSVLGRCRLVVRHDLGRVQWPIPNHHFVDDSVEPRRVDRGVAPDGYRAVVGRIEIGPSGARGILLAVDVNGQCVSATGTNDVRPLVGRHHRIAVEAIAVVHRYFATVVHIQPQDGTTRDARSLG